MTKMTDARRKKITKILSVSAAALLLGVTFSVIPKAIGLIPKMPSAVLQSLSGYKANEEKPVFASGKGEEVSCEESCADPEASEEESIFIPSAGDDDLFVTASNLCWYSNAEDAAIYVINRTAYKVEPKKFLEKEYPIKASNNGTEPIVLIVHTHGSESYLAAGYDFYSQSETFRSTDEEKTVVRIGDVLCKELNEKGVPTVHDRTMYDTTDFNKSYTYSKAGIQNMLELYPTIQYVIDLHRDSIFNSKGDNIKPIADIGGKECAQLMLVIGTDEGGSGHTGWRDNFTFAVYLEQELNERYPTLARPINLRTAAFNQMLTKGSIILECGSCGNTIEEAENAIILFAEAYASLLKKH